MCEHVSFQADGLVARVAALLAIEKLLSAVRQHVFFQITDCCARVAALLAAERFLSSVSEHVGLKVSFGCACTVALLRDDIHKKKIGLNGHCPFGGGGG